MRDERTWVASRLWDLGGLELGVRRNGEGDLEKFGRCHRCRDTRGAESSSLEAGHDRRELIVERVVLFGDEEAVKS